MSKKATIPSRVFMLLLLFTLNGCSFLYTPQPTKTRFMPTELPEDARELAFETIIISDYYSEYKNREPDLLVISTSDQAREFKYMLYPEQPILSTVNFEQYFVLITFYGYRREGGPRIEIKQIIRLNHQINIYAYFTDLPPGAPRPAEVVSPFHLVKVRKEGKWGDDFTFILYDNEKPVAQVTHFIP